MPGNDLTTPTASRAPRGSRRLRSRRNPGTGRLTPAAVLRINGRSNITLSGLGIDGNWGNALTEIAVASDGRALGGTGGRIHVKSTADFPKPEGTIQVMTSVGVTQTVHYREVTATVTETSFKECTGGEGAIFCGAA